MWYGAFADLHAEWPVFSESTIRGWYHQWFAHDAWRPYHTRHEQSHRKFTVEQEERIIESVSKYWEDERMISQSQVKAIAVDQWKKLGSETQTTTFSASDKFLVGLEERHNLSLRTPTIKKKVPVSDPDRNAQYLEQIRAARATYGDGRVVNMDETAWKDIQMGGRTVAPRGVKSVPVRVKGDVKAAMSAICAISAAGDKLPPVYILQAESDRCLNTLQPHVPPERVTFSPNGWMNEPVMLRYLGWLYEVLDSSPFALVMDSFPAHITEAVRHRANGLRIEFILVPEGLTGDFQPLDRGAFGPLKAMGQALWGNDRPGIRISNGSTRNLQCCSRWRGSAAEGCNS
jgi:hypothetical protein